MYISIGIIFLILLISLSFVGISYCVVETSTTNPSHKYYYDNNQRIYLDFPATWIEEEDQSSSVLLTGAGASLTIFNLIPTPGSYFPSAETPIEQVVNDLVETYKNIPTIHLDSHKQFTISDTTGYYLRVSTNQQGVEPVLIDNFIVLSGGHMYDIRYTVPQSLYNQYIPTRDLILDTISLGNNYDKEITPILNSMKINEDTSNKQQQVLANAIRDAGLKVNEIITDGIGSIGNEACTSSNYPNTYPNCY